MTPDLDALLADPLKVVTIPREQAERLILAATEVEGRARLVRELLLTRLAMPGPTASAPDDQVDDVHEVARLVRRSVSWVRKQGHTLPGFLQPGGKGHRVAWSRRALLAWANGGPLDAPSHRVMHHA
jgi:hypothetical protein